MERRTSSTIEFKPTTDPSLQEILVALSFALDLTEDAVPGHAIRSCLLGVRLALALRMDHATISDLYYSSLLKDVGCSSNSARMCQIVGGDDRETKAGAKLADWTQPMKPQLSTIKLLWKQVLPNASFLERGARILKLAAKQHTNNRELIELRCDRGAQIVRKLGLGDEVAIAVRHLDEHWDGGGYPLGLKGRSIPVISRIMGVAQHLDAFCMDQGPQTAIDVLVERSRRWFDPDLVAGAVSLHKSGDLWQQCLPGHPVEETFATAMRLHKNSHHVLSSDNIDTICEAFSDVVDAKSPFTYRHSIGVRDAAIAIGGVIGLPEDRMRMLRRAALLHDLGKLGVSNTILDKNGKLTDEEFLRVKGHPLMSAQILSRVTAFDEISVIAGEHHEKLDGSGYPHRLTATDLSLESRILAVADIFGALSEERPYRGALPPEKITEIMEKDVPHKLDAMCYEALRVVMAGAVWPSREKVQEIGMGCLLPMAVPVGAKA